ncbi:MAG: exodeoxyribonuclease VII small subunit [Candidatus Saccharimonadales bacterium]
MAKTTPTYEELKSELDAISMELQNGDLDVDQTVQKYERGLELVKQLQSQLTAAENTITKLQAKFTDGK